MSGSDGTILPLNKRFHILQLSIDQHWSDIYDQGRDFMLARSQEITRFLIYADSAAPKTALDIGSGTGQLTRELFHRGYKCVGIDASSSAVKMAESLTVVPKDSMTYLHFDIENDDLGRLPHASYGFITCKLVYAFIKDREAFLKRVSDLLAPNGLFVLVTPLPEDVPIEKKNIASSPEAMSLLSDYFNEVAIYRELGLTYFIGKPKPGERQLQK